MKEHKISKFTITAFLLLFLGFDSSSFSQKGNLNIPKEKIYIHFDKPYYYSSETIWFKVYLVNAATHSSETISKVVYVELISPENKIIETKTIKINEGGGEGDFMLSAGLIGGEYIVRAYTNYMQNF